MEFCVAPQDRDALRLAGLDSFEALMRSGCGRPVSTQPTREVLELRLPHERAYLKRAWGEKPLKLLSSWLLGRRPQAAPVREYLMLKRLHDAGLPAARPVAWGQRRLLGVPTEGFLLTAAVEGRSFDGVLVESQGESRLRWIEAMGSLLGRLHAAGFFHIIRLKDLIATPDGRLVMIDREVAHPWPRRFNPERCRQGLARCAAKFIRSGHSITNTELLALTWAYLKEVRPRWDGQPDELRRGVEPMLNDILAQPRYREKMRGDARTPRQDNTRSSG